MKASAAGESYLDLSPKAMFISHWRILWLLRRNFPAKFDGLNYVSFRRGVYSPVEQPNMSLETQELEPPSQPHHKMNFRRISHLRY